MIWIVSRASSQPLVSKKRPAVSSERLIKSLLQKSKAVMLFTDSQVYAPSRSIVIRVLPAAVLLPAWQLLLAFPSLLLRVTCDDRMRLATTQAIDRCCTPSRRFSLPWNSSRQLPYQRLAHHPEGSLSIKPPHSLNERREGFLNRVYCYVYAKYAILFSLRQSVVVKDDQTAKF